MENGHDLRPPQPGHRYRGLQQSTPSGRWLRVPTGGVQYVRVPNIMPTIHELNVKPAREAIHGSLSGRSPGPRASRSSGQPGGQNRCSHPPARCSWPVSCCPAAATSTTAWALILVDIGGATTDIHSALPGLENSPSRSGGLVINNEKQFSYRTVEGNLGLRVSATGIPEAVGATPSSAPWTGIGRHTRRGAELRGTWRTAPSMSPRARRNPWSGRWPPAPSSTALRRHAGYYVEAADPGDEASWRAPPWARICAMWGGFSLVGGIFVHVRGPRTRPREWWRAALKTPASPCCRSRSLRSYWTGLSAVRHGRPGISP